MIQTATAIYGVRINVA